MPAKVRSAGGRRTGRLSTGEVGEGSLTAAASCHARDRAEASGVRVASGRRVAANVRIIAALTDPAPGGGGPKKIPGVPLMTRSWSAAAALLVTVCSTAQADEGMWTFHGFPFDKANAALKTKLDQAWLDRVRLSTVRLSNCTGSFVSGNGLVLTNHHCVEGCLAELSSKEKSLVEDGFLAAKPAD